MCSLIALPYNFIGIICSAINIFLCCLHIGIH